MDVAGSVVSIVALTLQIGDKVQQIHDFWHSFKHASAEVQQIVEDLDAFDDLLAAGPRSNASPDPSVLKILKRCDAKVDTLRQHVATLEPGFKSTKAVSRYWSSLNAVLKRKIIEKSQTAIRDAKSDLLLANQKIAESLVRAGNADLIKDTAALRSEQSGLISTVTSVETQTQDLKKHVADVHKGLQKIARQNEAQANLAVGHFAAGPLGQMMQTAVDQALDKSGLRDFMKGITKGTESRGSEPLPESHDVGTQSDEFCNGPSHPSPQCVSGTSQQSARKSHRTSIQSTGGIYRSVFGNLSWRSRAIRTVHTNYPLETSRVETYICWQPAQWLLGRSVNIVLSRGDFGNMYKIIPSRLVSWDAPIWSSCERGKQVNIAEIARLFQDNLASPLDVDHKGHTLLHSAALHNNSALCDFLIKAGANPDAVTDRGETPLIMVFYGDVRTRSIQETIRSLISLGRADTTLINSSQSSVFAHQQAQFQDLLWLLRQEETYFDPNQYSYGATPIMDTIYLGGTAHEKIEMIDLLIELGGDVDARASSEESALHVVVYNEAPAAEVNAIEILAVCLLNHGANPHLVDADGATPTAFAMRAGPEAFLNWRNAVQVCCNVKDFVNAELETQSELYAQGWTHETLGTALNIDIADDRIAYYEGFMLYCKCHCFNRDWRYISDLHQWWYDLLDLIKSGKRPIPPLLKGWRKATSCNGETYYVHTRTGRLRSDRPQGLLLSNLTSKKSQERYKQGKIRIKVEADGDDAKSPHQESAHEKALHHFYSFMSDYSDEGSDEQLDDDFIDATSEDSDDDNETVMWTAEEGHLDFEESEADEDFEDAVEVLA